MGAFVEAVYVWLRAQSGRHMRIYDSLGGAFCLTLHFLDRAAERREIKRMNEDNLGLICVCGEAGIDLRGRLRCACMENRRLAR